MNKSTGVRQTRIDYYDNVKGFLIFTVVLGHAFEYYLKTSETMTLLYNIIYSFHMPLFIFVSGYFSKDINKSRDKVLEKLLIPYLLFDIAFAALEYFATGNNRMNILTPAFAFWYLLALIWYRIFIRDLTKIRFIVPISFVFSIIVGYFASVTSYLALNRTIAFLPFFLLGFYFSEDKLLSLKRIKSLYSALLGIVGCIVIFIITNSQIILDFQMIALNTHGIIDVLYRVIRLLLAILFGVVILNLIPTRKTILTKIGKNSMIIFLGHGFINGVVRVINPFTNNSTINFIFLIVFSVAITLLLSLDIFSKMYDIFLNAVCRVILFKEKKSAFVSGKTHSI